MVKDTRTGCLSSNTLENIIDKRVQNGHSLVRDTRVWVDLLEDCRAISEMTKRTRKIKPTLVNVRGVRLFADFLALLLLAVSSGRCFLRSLFSCSRSLGRRGLLGGSR